MRLQLILLGAVAAASASFAESRLEERTICTSHLYNLCCGTSNWGWKRSLEARTLCRWCNCPAPQPQPQPQPEPQPQPQPEPQPQPTSKPVEPPVSTSKASETTPTSSETKKPEPTTSTVAPSPPQESGPGSCKATVNGPNASYTDANGVEYKVNCGRDIAGGDFAARPAPNFVGCFDLCSKSDECVGFSWLSGTCYLKSSQNGPLVPSPADVAQKVNFTPPKPTTTAQPTTTTAAPTGPTTIPTGACKAIGNGASLGAYTVECGVDYPGGDLSNAPSPSFAGCAAQCGKLPGCLGFSFLGGTGSGVCYFKDNKTRASNSPNVDSAFRPTPVIPGIPKPTSTSTSTTVATTEKPSSTSTNMKTTTTQASTTTTAAAPPPPQPTKSPLTYELQLFDDYSCRRPTQVLRVDRAQAGQCISLDALQKSDSFRYKTFGDASSSCRLIAYNLRNCSGRSIVYCDSGKSVPTLELLTTT